MARPDRQRKRGRAENLGEFTRAPAAFGWPPSPGQEIARGSADRDGAEDRSGLGVAEPETVHEHEHDAAQSEPPRTAPQPAPAPHARRRVYHPSSGMRHDRRARAWYNSAFMLRTERAPEPPEHGSHHGIRLHGGRFRDAEALAPPPWALRGALYSIYPRAFSTEGTLTAIVPHLGRIAELGASAIWLLPVHPTGIEARKGTRGSPYAVRDYREVDPALGTLDDLRRLVDAAHARGLKVIIDFVANHAAQRSRLAGEQPGGSPATSRAGPPGVSPSGPTWPIGATTSRAWRSTWSRARPSGCGRRGWTGIRCDVAGMVPRAFWDDVHRRLAALRSDHFLLAEWQDPELHTIALSRLLRLGALPRAARRGPWDTRDASAVGEALASLGGQLSRPAPCRCASWRTTTSRGRWQIFGRSGSAPAPRSRSSPAGCRSSTMARKWAPRTGRASSSAEPIDWAASGARARGLSGT